MNSEHGLLLPKATNRASRLTKWLKTRLLVNSKAANLILLWNMAGLLGFKMVYNVDTVMQVTYTEFIPIIVMTLFCVITVLSPIIGSIADIKLSRHKAVLCSTYVTLGEVVAMVLIAIYGAFLIAVKLDFQLGKHRALSFSIQAFLLLFLGALIVSFVVFIINAFQFGLDQLHNSSTEDLIAYIHWYVWVYYLSCLLTEIQWNLLLYDEYYVNYLDQTRISGICVLALNFTAIFTLFIISSCVIKRRQLWFLLEPSVPNPYKLVYRVIKFARQHKVPLRRSAFTYCEDEIPSGLDLGKTKYGGPFTTREVEDVKAFLGILKVLVSICPVFLLQTTVQSLLPAFPRHSNIIFFKTMNSDNASIIKHQVHFEGIARHIIVSNGLLSPMLVVVCVPLYLWCVRPRILYHIPGFFKRIGVGIVLIILSLLCALVMDVVVHAHNTEYATCMFSSYGGTDKLIQVNTTSHHGLPLFQNAYFFTAQHILSSFIDMLLDIAVLEFICSQSPYSMRGLVFGLSFSLRSLSQGLAVVSMVPFGTLWKESYVLSCGSSFYLMNIVLAIFTLLLFVHTVIRKYKYRELNEPSNEYRYAEEYYSNIQ